MAKWSVYRNQKGSLNLSYGSRLYDKTFDCGEIRDGTPRMLILQWVMDQNPNPGDLLRFEDGSSLVVHPEGAVA